MMVNLEDPNAHAVYENGDLPSQQNGGSKQNNDGADRIRVQYTIPGVLHFIQHEWARFEMERAQWEVERAELQARIAFLQGERKGQENLKNDLVRRIKMLEYALKQERIKYHKLKYGEDLDLSAVGGDEQPDDQQIPTDIEATSQPNSNLSWRQGRQLLRQYLQEIGYTDAILDMRSFRVRNLLGGGGGGGGMESETTEGSPGRRSVGGGGAAPSKPTGNREASGMNQVMLPLDDDSDNDEDMVIDRKRPKPDVDDGQMDDEIGMEEKDALSEFDFLGGDWNTSAKEITQKKEQFRKEQLSKRDMQRPKRSDLQAMLRNLNDSNEANVPRQPAPSLSEIEGTAYSLNQRNTLPPGVLEEGVTDIDMALNLNNLGELAMLGNVNESDPMSADVTSAGNKSDRKTWTCQYNLKSHFDCVRAMGFHPVEAVLITASEDATLKLWNLQRPSTTSSPQSPQNLANKKAAALMADIEPVYTFRGHNGPILCLCMSPTGDMCYSGGLDGTIRCWSIPSPNVDPYDKFDPSVLAETLRGHDDAIWSVAFHSSDQRLISASADGTVKLWEPGLPDPLLRSFKPDSVEGVPTSVDFVNTDPALAVAAYTSAYACIYDLESGKVRLNFDCKNHTRSQINQIVSHPTLPITITAGEDRYIRYFDNNSGKLIDSVVAHLDAVTCLSIDPNGLFLLSGSHDCSIRLWNLDTKNCIQEITAHRKKFDESIFSVAFHSSRPLLASAGADGIVKVFA